jgi:hypothetical protein
MDEVAPTSWRIMVRPDRHDLYVDLRKSLGGDPRVAVVVDRRKAARRVATSPAEPDRRRRDRRATFAGKTLDLWDTVGLKLEETYTVRQWEYRFEEIYTREAARINRLGEDGWEAVSTTISQKGEPIKCLVLFKRPKRD